MNHVCPCRLRILNISHPLMISIIFETPHLVFHWYVVFEWCNGDARATSKWCFETPILHKLALVFQNTAETPYLVFSWRCYVVFEWCSSGDARAASKWCLETPKLQNTSVGVSKHHWNSDETPVELWNSSETPPFLWILETPIVGGFETLAKLQEEF